LVTSIVRAVDTSESEVATRWGRTHDEVASGVGIGVDGVGREAEPLGAMGLEGDRKVSWRLDDGLGPYQMKRSSLVQLRTSGNTHCVARLQDPHVN
jgi:hypothetical protein